MIKRLENLDEYLLMALLFASTALIFVQVVMRYVFMNSLSWSEELARYMYVWQTWLAASYAVRKGRHLRITSLTDKLKAPTSIIIELAVIVLWFCFSVYLCAKSVDLVSMIRMQGQTSPAMDMPMWFAYLAVPVGTALMALRLVQSFAQNIRKLKGATDAAEEEDL